MNKIGKLLGTGATTEVYEYGDDKVCKLYINKYDENEVRLEYEKTLNIYSNGLRAPSVYEIIEYDGRFGLVMERIHGITLKDDLFSYIQACINSGGSEQEISQSIYDYSIKQIKEIVAVLYNLHKNTCKLKINAKDKFSWHCENSKYLNQEEKALILKIIGDLPDSECVCHGDPNPNNLIYNNGEIKLIDWVDSVNAHPFYDITEYRLMTEYSDTPDFSAFPEYIAAFYHQYKNNSYKTFIDEYVRLSGIDLLGINCWVLPVLVFKMYGNNSKEKQQRLLEGIKSGLCNL